MILNSSRLKPLSKALAQANNAKVERNTLFKDGQYEEALSKYEIAIQVAPDGPSSSEMRSMCHANRAACFSKLELIPPYKGCFKRREEARLKAPPRGEAPGKRPEARFGDLKRRRTPSPIEASESQAFFITGKYEETIKECTKALELNHAYMKALLRRAEAHEKLEHYDESIIDMTKILELDPSNDQVRRSIIRLRPLADEKREKMKEEMIVPTSMLPRKLKEMGNSILGRFGMSVDNFKAVKDPNTGSYSVSIQR
ncbi:hypothetical protein OROGR_013746 [Orobanche gracilis]